MIGDVAIKTRETGDESARLVSPLALYSAARLTPVGMGSVRWGRCWESALYGIVWGTTGVAQARGEPDRGAVYEAAHFRARSLDVRHVCFQYFTAGWWTDEGRALGGRTERKFGRKLSLSALRRTAAHPSERRTTDGDDCHEEKPPARCRHEGKPRSAVGKTNADPLRACQAAGGGRARCTPARFPALLTTPFPILQPLSLLASCA
ncbi:hypothetical protein HPB50_010706 [Hyalomma asiaticum]|uniref:Uncharacterized protein n=1 Tax=Hyalomma asiaticum TaxID=266040 RepID=A0ACB7SEA3_HYAAI|nr:hypothetical protein HPB50_010706 [Hyalomma asiaticum]